MAEVVTVTGHGSFRDERRAMEKVVFFLFFFPEVSCEETRIGIFTYMNG